MNAMDLNREKYPDPIIHGAIQKAIEECNRRVSKADVLTHIVGGLYSEHKYKTIDTMEKRFLGERITDAMTALGFQREGKSHKYVVWLVK